MAEAVLAGVASAADSVARKISQTSLRRGFSSATDGEETKRRSDEVIQPKLRLSVSPSLRNSASFRYNAQSAMFRILKSVLRSTGRAARHDPELRAWFARHPRVFGFLKRRLSPDEKFGLDLTVGAIVTLLFVYLFFGVVQSLVGERMLYQADARVINLVQIFRSPGFSRVMLFFTYLGQWPVVLTGVVGLGLVLAVLRRWRGLAVIVCSVAFGELFVWLVEHGLRRPRPPLSGALTLMSGYSFPSGHAFVAVSFYGLLAYLLFRFARRRAVKSFIVAAAAVVVAGIAFSRIYLGVHWPSDVLASLAAGAAWLTVLITALEIRRKFNHRLPPEARWRRQSVVILASVVAVAWSLFVVGYYLSYPLAPPSVAGGNVRTIMAADVGPGLFADLPRASETLAGRPMEPVNVIVIADETALTEVFAAAGWHTMDGFSPASLGRMTYASIFDQAYPQGPGIPSFWNSRPNDLALQQPTEKQSIRERHHVHFWLSPFSLVDGRRVWFGTAHFDRGVKAAAAALVPVHSIDPAVDEEREKIVTDLRASAAFESDFSFEIVKPQLGQNGAGDPFFTDGRTAVIFLKP